MYGELKFLGIVVAVRIVLGFASWMFPVVGSGIGTSTNNFAQNAWTRHRTVNSPTGARLPRRPSPYRNWRRWALGAIACVPLIAILNAITKPTEGAPIGIPEPLRFWLIVVMIAVTIAACVFIWRALGPVNRLPGLSRGTFIAIVLAQLVLHPWTW